MANTRQFNLKEDEWRHVATGGDVVTLKTRGIVNELHAYVGPAIGPEGTAEVMTIGRNGAVLKGVGEKDMVYVRSDLVCHLEVGVGLEYVPLPQA